MKHLNRVRFVGRPGLLAAGLVAFFLFSSSRANAQETEATRSTTASPEAASETSPELTNTICPVLPDEPVDPSVFVEYEGKRVYFCCSMCRRQFLEDPEKFVPNLAQFRQTAALGDSTLSTDSPTTPAYEEETSGTSDGPAHEHGEEEAAASAPARSAEDSHEHSESEEAAHQAATEEESHAHEATTAEEHEHAEEGEAHEGHEHVQTESVVHRAIRFLGKCHPVVIHFPIALLLAGALAEFIGLFSSSAFWETSGRYSAILGALGAAVAALLGWAKAAFSSFPTMEWVEEVHRWLGTSTALIAIVAVICGELARRHQSTSLRKAYLVLLFLSAVVVGVTGHFGATLVYGLGYFTH